MPPDYAAAMRRALKTLRDADDNDSNEALHRAARALPAHVLTINDVIEAVVPAFRDQRRELVEHMNRLLRLVELKQSRGKEEMRDKNFHQRLCVLESQMRALQRKGSR